MNQGYNIFIIRKDTFDESIGIVHMFHFTVHEYNMDLDG